MASVACNNSQRIVDRRFDTFLPQFTFAGFLAFVYANSKGYGQYEKYDHASDTASQGNEADVTVTRVAVVVEAVERIAGASVAALCVDADVVTSRCAAGISALVKI